MTVHAFVDESTRKQLYLVAVTVARPDQLGPLRRQLKAMLLPGQREIHIAKQKADRKRFLADQMATLSVQARIYTSTCAPKTEEDARQRCLHRTVTDLLADGAHRLVLDTREWHRDRHDIGTLQRALGARPSKTELTYEHLESGLEPLLWVSDVVAWCYGAGGDMRARVQPIVAEVIDL